METLRVRLRAGVLAAALATLTLGLGCGGDSGPTNTGSNVASIALSFTSSTLSLGALEPLSPDYRDAQGGAISTVTNAVWTSSNSGIISVDHFGRVTGVALGGPVTITVKVGAKSASLPLTVVPDKISITPALLTLPVSQSTQLTASPLDAHGTAISSSLAPVTWNSSNTNAATVSSTGLLSGIAAGKTTITATAAGLTNSFAIEVGVPSPYDGDWAGLSANGAHPITFTVLFGTVRSFDMTYFTPFQSPYSATCTRSIDAVGNPNAPITDGQFSFTLTIPPTGMVAGTFTSPTKMTGSFLTPIPLGSYQCSTLENGDAVTPVSVNATVPVSPYTAVKQ